jgi:hypothetical protein
MDRDFSADHLNRFVIAGREMRDDSAATDSVLGRGAPASVITRLAMRIIGRSLTRLGRPLIVAEPARPAAWVPQLIGFLVRVPG